MLTNVETELADEYIGRGYSAAKAARFLGKTVAEVQAALLHEGQHGPRAVASKHVNQVWDNENPDIIQARQRYDAGICELATGRTGDTLTLYEIPRVHPLPNRVPYFSRPLGEE